MKLTYEEIILHVLNDAEVWVVSHQLEKVDTPWGWIGTRGSRTCRDMETRGLIEKDLTVYKPYVAYKITELGKERLEAVKPVLGHPRASQEDMWSTLPGDWKPVQESYNKLFKF